MLYYDVVRTSFGEVTLVSSDDGLVSLGLPSAGREFHLAYLEKKYQMKPQRMPDRLKEAAARIGEYFAGRLTAFGLKINVSGSAWQRKIWAILREIPYGQTLTYGEVARIAGCPGAARAVGAACRTNPIPIIIPCHRVVGVHDLGGFSGGGIAVKERLLEHERRVLFELGKRAGK